MSLVTHLTERRNDGDKALYSGLIGILPYQTAMNMGRNPYRDSFLQQLYDNHIVSHQVVTFSSSENKRDEANGMYDAVVQIGGYDPNLFTGFNGGEPKIFKTLISPAF